MAKNYLYILCTLWLFVSCDSASFNYNGKNNLGFQYQSLQAIHNRELTKCDTIRKYDWYASHLNVEMFLYFLQGDPGSDVSIDPRKIPKAWLLYSDIPTLTNRLNDMTPCAKTVNGLISQGDDFENNSTIHEEVVKLMRFIVEGSMFGNSKSENEVIAEIMEIERKSNYIKNH